MDQHDHALFHKGEPANEAAHYDRNWIVSHGPFTWKRMINPYADDLTHVLVSCRGDHIHWYYNEEQAQRECDNVNTRWAALDMTKGTPAFGLV